MKRKTTNAPTERQMIDKTKFLERLMTVTDEEDVLLQWAFATLDRDQIEACLRTAKESAAVELRHDDAESLLTAVLAKVIIRGIRWLRLERTTLLASPSRDSSQPPLARKYKRAPKKK